MSLSNLQIDYDVIVIGGGFAGSCIAKALADANMNVLVVEREKKFKDRVRGEAIWPWGVIELEELGVYEILRKSCGHDIDWFDTFVGSMRADHRDLLSGTKQKRRALNFYHPSMQEALLHAAEGAGATIARPSRVTKIMPGRPPRVSFTCEEGERRASARLVIGADGKNSVTYKFSGFRRQKDNVGLMISGALLEGASGFAENTNYWMVNPEIGQGAFLAPQRNGRLRAYLLHRKNAHIKLKGDRRFSTYLAEIINAGAPASWIEGSKLTGPLATYDGTSTWVEFPYESGVALIGDAAASTDPSYGQGLSLSVLDVRNLRAKLLATDDWDMAGRSYAAEHAEHFRVVNTLIHWLWELFYERGEPANSRRAVAFPRIAEDPTRIPDVLLSGPEIDFKEEAKLKMFGQA